MAGIFPFMETAVKRKSGAALPVFREYAWDFERDALILVNGSPTVVERKEALKVWIYKVLRTPRFRYPVYTWSYGHELEGLIGSAYTNGAVQAETGGGGVYTNRVMQVEAERRVREALLVNPYITGVSVADVELIGSRLTVEVAVETVYGEVKMNV